MKKLCNFIVLLSTLLFLTLFTACVDDVEYRAEVSLKNATTSEVKDFFIFSDDIDLNRYLQSLPAGEEQNFEIRWIGQHNGFLGCTDDSHISVTAEYTIGDRKFTIADEKNVVIELDSSYYSQQTITNNTKVQIIITDDGYEVICVN